MSEKMLKCSLSSLISFDVPREQEKAISPFNTQVLPDLRYLRRSQKFWLILYELTDA